MRIRLRRRRGGSVPRLLETADKGLRFFASRKRFKLSTRVVLHLTEIREDASCEQEPY